MKRTALKRGTPIARRRAKLRRVSVVRDREYMDWLKAECNCVVCVTHSMTKWSVGNGPIIDPAHTVNNGRGSKGPDLSCIPLCRHHHDEMDGRLGTAITTKAQFAKKYGIDLAKEAETHYAAFKLLKAGNG